MALKRKLFENFNLYVVTDIDKETPDILTKIDRAFQGGAGIVQLRSKHLTDRAFIRLGTKIREIARIYGRGFVVNDRTDIAIAVNADAVHLGQGDLPISTARELIRASRLSIAIGKSTHSLVQALEAEEEGADYIGVGPIFTTPTKPNYEPVGISLIEQVKAKVRIPSVAIGGIHLENLGDVLLAGADSFAVVRAVFAADDPYLAAKKLREKYECFKKVEKSSKVKAAV